MSFDGAYQKIVTLQTAQVEIKLMSPDDEGALLGFMEKNLENWGKFRKLWQWRQENKEVSGGETAVIVEENGTIVGSVGIVHAEVVIKGKTVKASWQQDSLISPGMRGKGLGKKLVNEGAKGWDLVMAKGTSQEMYGLRKSVGFSDVPNSDYLVRIYKPRFVVRKPKESAAECVLAVWKSILPMPGTDSTVEVKEINAFDQTFDFLADELSKENVLRLHKNQKYLNWRYFECPGKHYKVFRAGGEKTRGALVLNITGQDFDEGWIVDLICYSKDKKCAYALLKAAMNYFKEQRVSRIWAFATLPAARRCLYRFGFLPTGRTPRFTYHVYGENLDPGILATTSWDFWHGDGDVELYI